MFTGAVLIIAHLAAARDLIQSGVYLDESGEDGESAVASHLAVPMGSGAIGIGVVLLISALGRKDDKETAAGNSTTSVRKYAPAAVMLSGLLCVAWHVAMLRSLTLSVEAFEHQPGFVPSGPEFEAEKARTHLELEKINVIFFLGMAIAFAGLVSSLDSPSKRETQPTE